MASSGSDLFDGQVEENKNFHENFGEMLSTLPKGLGAGGCYYQYQGFWYSSVWLLGTIWAQRSFRARDTDILLAASPKSGTTWMKALMFAIVNRKCYPHLPSSSLASHPLLTKSPHNCVPYLEVRDEEHMIGGNPIAYLDSLPPSSPRLLSTHIPYTSLPKSILSDSGGRIVYIARNPKDVFVSYWSFCQKFKSKTDQSKGQPLAAISMEEAFELFCKGVSITGPFWDHVLDYWKASLERPDQVVFMKYEDMKMDTMQHVKRLAEFMGHPFSLEEERQGVVQEIINLCSFQNLSNLEVNKSGAYHVHIASQTGQTPLLVNNSAFFRRGEVGDSKNHLTVEMLEHLDKITEEKLGSFGLKL
ncbi:unnamed protein product [Prunus armeniaca]|uniref:Sulfotransferase n=1 Tax=Prunus armeniaca TaxID=36596 RepID=A0A6J5UZ01_PRUAR|nr:unnamed protein product [Prunus armeniaca]